MTFTLDNHFFTLLKHKFALRFFFAIFIFLLAIATGIVGYMIIEDYTLNEAFYMAMITISTVGYGEVKPLSPDGRIFTSFLIIFNIGALAYIISVISSFIIEGDFKILFKEIKMEQDIKKLNRHVIVCGYGRLGRIICKDLEKTGCEILIVEYNEKVLKEVEQKGFLFYKGDATEDDTIINLGIDRAETLISTFHSDASNVYVVLAAREINPSLKIISRASEGPNLSKLKLAGANHVIIPEDLGGSYIAALVNGNENSIIKNWSH